MWFDIWTSCMRALLLVMMPQRCMGCRCMLTTSQPHQLCAACFKTLEPNVNKRCAHCDLPGAQSACLQCPIGQGAIEQMRMPLQLTQATLAILQAGRQVGRADVWLQCARIIAQDAKAQQLAREAIYLVPVASDLPRLWQRGFNPSAVLARHLARAWGMQVAYVLKRTRPAQRQHSCTPARRYRNMHATFTCTQKPAHTLVLIDDYVVTGATVHAAARALQQAGAQRIIVIAVARGKGR